VSGDSSWVLVTGATGFIGRAIAQRLIAAGRPVIALVRPHEAHVTVDRVAAAIGIAPDGRRLDTIELDLLRPERALSAADWRRLSDRVDTVIHCAGDTTFFPQAIESFRAGHIDGPCYLLDRLSAGRLRRWSHMSTAYVCGRRSGIVLEREGAVGQDFHNPYEQIKLESETAIRRAGQRRSVDVRVFRPSIVVGRAPATAGGNPSNSFFAFIAMVAALARSADGSEIPLRIHAAPAACFNIVPLEYVVAAVVALTELPEAREGTFHLVVADAPTQQAMLTMITEHLGARGLSVVDFRAELANPSPLERRTVRLLAPYWEYLTQDVRFDDATARRFLDRCGIPRPRLSPPEVHRLIDLALTTNGPIPVSVAP